MKKILFYSLWIVISFTCLALQTIPQAEAGSDYTGLDVVFLVDQSGSMGGKQFGSKLASQANDPNNLRFKGNREMAERLAQYRANYFHDSDVKFQVIVIYFGTTVYMPVSKLTIELRKGEKLSRSWLDGLLAERFKRNLGYTDHLRALKTAKNELLKMRSGWGKGRHLQSIFLITDGQPVVNCKEPALPGENRFYCRGSKFQPSEYARELESYIFNELPRSEFKLFVGVITDLSNIIWNQYGPKWEKWTVNNAKPLKANTMWTYLEEVLGKLTGRLLGKKILTKISRDQNEVYVKPYLNEIEFFIHKSSPHERAEFEQNGESIENKEGVEVHNSDQFIERILIRNPTPGIIIVKKPEDSVMEIFTRELSMSINRNIKQEVRQYDEIQIECILSDDLPSYHKDQTYPLEVKGTIREEDGNIKRIELKSKGSRSFVATYIPDKPGRHKLKIKARYWDSQKNERIQVFDELKHNFNVTSTKLLRPAILNPASKTDHTWRNLLWRPLPLEIQVAVVNESKPLEPAIFLKSPFKAPLEAKIIPPGGKPKPLTLTQSNNSGIYTTSFNPYDKSLRFTHKDLGMYDISVEPTNSVADLKEGYIFQKGNAVICQVHLTRHPIWWILPGLFFVLFIVLTGLAAYGTYLRCWSAPGYLTINSDNPRDKRVSHLGGFHKHRIVLTGRKLPPGINKVIVRQPLKEKKQINVTVRTDKGSLSYQMRDNQVKPLTGDKSLHYKRGESELVKISLNLHMILFSLLTLSCFACLSVVLYSVFFSLF